MPDPGPTSAHPAPPDGYATWLDYAVACMDTRAVEVSLSLGDTPSPPTQQAMRNAAKAELEDLRNRAARAS